MPRQAKDPLPAQPLASAASQEPVKRRRVYYICGVDPRGAKFYHQMWQSEAPLQTAVDGRRYAVGDAVEEGPLFTRWTVQAQADGHETESQHVFMRWDDLMREYWPSSHLETLRRLPGLYWMYVTSGMLARTWSSARGFFWAYFLMPVIYALLVPLIAGGAGWAAATLVGAAGAPSWAGWLAAIVATVTLVQTALANAEHIRLFWLCRAQVFMGLWAVRRPEAFSQRWRDFARKIHDDLQRDTPATAPDEVLIVAHCGGAPAAVQVAHEWLALQAADPVVHAPVKLLTLGQAIPLLGMVPQAGWFREQLRGLGEAGLPWLDYTAPADPLCYALANPFTTCGVPMPAAARYRLKSSRFDRMFPPAEYARIRKNIFRVHFQYLMSTQCPVDNDWFQLTCGPRALGVEALAPAAAEFPRPTSMPYRDFA